MIILILLGPMVAVSCWALTVAWRRGTYRHPKIDAYGWFPADSNPPRPGLYVRDYTDEGVDSASWADYYCGRGKWRFSSRTGMRSVVRRRWRYAETWAPCNR